MPEQIGKKIFEKLLKSFKALCDNGDIKNLPNNLDYYMTEKSFKQNFHVAFGYENHFFAEMLFKFITSKNLRFLHNQAAGINFLEFF